MDNKGSGWTHVGMQMLPKAIAAAAVFMMFGCGLLDACAAATAEYPPPASMALEDVVGYWQARTDDLDLLFTNDGEFSSADLPYGRVIEAAGLPIPGPQTETRSKFPASGTWELAQWKGTRRSPAATAPVSEVHLHIRMFAGKQVDVETTLRGEWEGSTLVITFYYGGPNVMSRLVYQKCRNNCPLPQRHP
jgi:hypothetical protein